ncbi:MAG: M3 family oligoendopeptidase [Bacteroidetes bacterium]|nr:M3 family oligoendopeptidase [Bacteroidota bacterium]
MQRKFIPSDFEITTWDKLKIYFDKLLKQEIKNSTELEIFLKDISELSSVISENMAWRYIKMTCDTNNTKLRDSFNDFIQNIEPHLAAISNELNKKINDCAFKNELNKAGYDIYFKGIKNSIDLFREENIPLNTKLQELEQKFGEISGAQSIDYNGEKITLQKAATYLKELNRSIREDVYHKIQHRRAADENALNQLYTELIQLRHKVATNTGFKNYRDYKHQALGRFDYTVNDCLTFHESVKQYAVPVLNKLHEHRKHKLKLNDYRPWDTSVDEDQLSALKPFTNASDLTDKTIKCFSKIDPYFSECINTMQKLKRLDLESRIGKAPGGYQYPLYETGVPFIFMNAVGLLRDLTTMVHEGGHAIHSFLYEHLELIEFKSPPSEVAELASMSMELISMEYWNDFFLNDNELKRAKKQQLESVIDTLPWIATIDKFQHWVYTNPQHSLEERATAWTKIAEEFNPPAINYKGLEKNFQRKWQMQLHLFEVPFYYIEYGFAQLGAIAMWQQFKQNPKQAIANYKKALSLGYTQSIPKIYEAAGIKFNFSAEYIKNLMTFVWSEYEKL